LGVGSTVTCTLKLRPACSQPTLGSPTPGICLARRTFTSSFSAQMCASSTLDCRCALLVRAASPAGRRPARSRRCQRDQHLDQREAAGALRFMACPRRHGERPQPSVATRRLRPGSRR
jgi:hypothetical protein